MVGRYPSNCVNCGPCERYTCNDQCVTCAARCSKERLALRKQARELGATSADITTGSRCRVCGEPWRYILSHRCVTCAEANGTAPKPPKPPKPKPELKGGYLGKRPRKKYNYKLLATVTLDGYNWELWDRKNEEGWHGMKLCVTGRRPKKANFWLGWSDNERRFQRHSESMILESREPVLCAFTKAAMQGDDIETLFGGRYD